ncbi:MAG TPA: trypsin-like peptidase domain-containing protein [Anaeromyxobacter sp.]|nr:trypsin-like peptidase domain-containing protein [Anaeromyxobacter sp.]
MRKRAAPSRFAALAIAAALFPASASAAGVLPQADERPSPSRRTQVVTAVERVRGAVVNVAAEELVRFRDRRSGSIADYFFGDLFDRRQARRGYAVTSLGSGVIVSPDGWVLTNNHVIERGTRFRVGLLDGRELLAKVVGTDPSSDLAVLRLDTKEKLPYAVMGSSDGLLIGETVIAIGNPFGLSHTVTTGVVSAIHRNFKAGDRTLFDFIQTDASINPGNSGGALLDIEGRLIGVNTAILGDRNAGIGFAIPIDRARRVAEDLVAHGAVREGYVGVTVDDLPAKDGRADASGGVVVTGVDPGSPAEKAGVRKGDVVESVQGFPPQSAEEFRFRVRDLAVGSTARLDLARKGNRVHASVAAIELSPESVSELVARRTGLTVSEERVQGGALVVVKAVARGSLAARYGIQAGDLVREVNSTEVSTLSEFRRAASRARRSGVLVLLVERGFASERIPFGLD